jgi:hypothetical protein
LNKNKYNIYVHTLDEQKEYINDIKGVTVSRTKNDTLLKPLLFTNRTNKLIHYSKVIYNMIIRKFTKNIYQKWIDDSYIVLKQKIKEQNIDLILSSFAPDASHILAIRLKKEFPHIKFIADMRDEMSFSPYIGIQKKNEYISIEEDIFKYASAITSVSKPILDEFENLSNNKNIKFTEIRNGYDFELENNKSENKSFTIVYTGNFYADINPNNFLKVLEYIVINNKIKDIKVKFVGVKTHFEIPSILKNMIEIIPSVIHSKAINIMKNSDVLLLIHPSNGRKGVFTGKLFEYLAVLKPIIALIDEEDVAAKLINKCNAGYVCDDKNIKKMQEIIFDAYGEWKNKSKREFNITEIKKHHRFEQTKRLEVLIDEILDES